MSKSKSKSKSGSIPLPRLAPGPDGPLNFIAELCQNRNNTVSVPGLSRPNPIPRPFDTDPELASPLTFSDNL
ncbi:MAG TPA: hypothetical protein DEW46_18170 [Verrucomicrobia bacterium]|nr:hypothetical protein [Verrucomicrobiota bacterium]